MAVAQRRVLIVDDEQALLQSLAAAVQTSGHLVETALNGLHALEMAQERPFDLVVTDLRMPVLDGSSLIARLLEERKAPRVIVVTGFATLDSAIDCLRKGAVDFLVKPFAVATFLRSVEKALERPAQHDAGQKTVGWDSLKQEFDLSRRQLATLQTFYSTGKSNRDLAEHLCLSQDTVKTHLRIAFHKLGVSNRAQLFRMLNDRGYRP